jgi:aspartyl-tRNA(Asn)/glutamyl-tRNA(Gln) amidotransferase subunit A
MDTVIEIADAVRRGRRKAIEVLDACLDEIARDNERLNAFVHLDPDLARRAAEAVDEKVARGDDPGPLAGVPFGVKDLEDCAGMPTSHGSLIFKGDPPVGEDSIHVGRLRAAGAIPVGKTAAPEFGCTCFTSTKAWGTTRNPWNPDLTPGGSSGGSAAAVAAGLIPFCTASDGGGSIRIPASFSGLVGLKPSFGRIADPAYCLSLTTVVGSLTTTVGDAARHLDVSAGPDDRDKTSLPAPGLNYEQAIEDLNVRGLRAVWSPDLGFASVDPEVLMIAQAAAEKVIDAGGLTAVNRGVEFTDPLRVWMMAGDGDTWVHLDKGMFPERADEFTGIVRHTLDHSYELTLPRFVRRFKWRKLLEQQVAALFGDVDVLLTPTTAVPAFAADGPIPTEIDGQTVAPGMAVPFTMLANLCWNPAISVPAGLTAAGLPVGLQIMARRHADEVVLRLARILEDAQPWPRFAP